MYLDIKYQVGVVRTVSDFLDVLVEMVYQKCIFHDVLYYDRCLKL